MPSFQHDMLVELFRTRSELAPALLARLAGVKLDYASAEQGSIDLSQVVPVEYRADDVVILRDRDHAAVYALIIEIQLRADPRKRFSWPSYIANLRARHECPVLLIVVVPDPSVACWARTTIATGHPGFELTPIVLEIDEVSRIIDLEMTAKLPELTLIPLTPPADPEIIRIALDAFQQLPGDRGRLYSHLLLSAGTSRDPRRPGG